MAEEFMMFDSVDGDREVTAADFAKYYHEILTNGVFYRNAEPSLRARRASGLISTVEIGAAFVEGYMYRNTEEIELSHSMGDSSYPRIDRIVVRLDRGIANRNIRTVVKEGVPSSNPRAPALQRDDLVYELSLARVRVNAGSGEINQLLDERFDQFLCGVVSSLIEVPTSSFLEDWNAFFSDITESMDNAASNFESELQGNLTDYEEQFQQWLSEQQTEGFILGGFRFYTGDEPPSNPSLNDRWLDTRTSTEKYWRGGKWMSLGGASHDKFTYSGDVETTTVDGEVTGLNIEGPGYLSYLGARTNVSDDLFMYAKLIVDGEVYLLQRVTGDIALTGSPGVSFLGTASYYSVARGDVYATFPADLFAVSLGVYRVDGNIPTTNMTLPSDKNPSGNSQSILLLDEPISFDQSLEVRFYSTISDALGRVAFACAGGMTR